jgi:hypothetical protein
MPRRPQRSRRSPQSIEKLAGRALACTVNHRFMPDFRDSMSVYRPCLFIVPSPAWLAYGSSLQALLSSVEVIKAA